MTKKKRHDPFCKQGRTGLKGKGHVYFVMGVRTNLVKIGFSQDAFRRIRSVAQGCSESINADLVILGTRADEKALHKRFAKHRVKGEWFEDCDEITAYVKECHRRSDICVYSNPWNAIL